MKKQKLMLGDNILSLKKLPDNSIDSVVTDPPYGLSFMNKKWDYEVPSVEFWKEVYRVLKPGGHILSFGGTRTYHRMVVNIEDAGFEIRDQIMWLYGSGFPKSHNIGKSVDKLEGNEREVIDKLFPDGSKPRQSQQLKIYNDDEKYIGAPKYTKGQSEWEGWGSALKPANEPICLARKPLSEKSIAENVLKWRTGGLNIDACRVGNEKIISRPGMKPGNFQGVDSNSKKQNELITENEGRFPANIILECVCDDLIEGKTLKANENYKWSNTDSNSEIFKGRGKYTPRKDVLQHHTNPDCPCYSLDEQSGVSKSIKSKRGTACCGNDEGRYNWNNGEINDFDTIRGHNDSGGASRFFYVAKVSKAERNMGLDEFEDKKGGSMIGNTLDKMSLGGASLKNEHKEIQKTKNNHPTVKPVNLMSYLCKLITPPNGIVLDPFMGSGSTGIAALLNDFRFVGMEMDPDYFKIAEARINSYEEYRKFLKI